MGRYGEPAPDYERPRITGAIGALAGGWALGGLAVLAWPGRLPPVLAALAAVAAALAIWRRCPAAAAVLVATVLTFGAVESGLSDRLDPELDGARLAVVGIVDDLPREETRRRVLTLRVESPSGLPGRLRLAWYEPGTAPMPAPGERWRFQARLRVPRGLANPGGGDWEGFLLRAGIGATGYASGPTGGIRIEGGADSWLTLRGRVARDVAAAAGNGVAGQVLVAIVTGFRAGLPPALRDTLAKTGTGHLLAISGLHVGLAAGLGGIAAMLAARVPGARGRPRPDWAAAGAVLAASAYATLAGWPVSTRRAVVMLAAGLLALVLRRRPGAFVILALAWVGVLASDPLGLLDPGFWMSFGAVAAIAWVLAARTGTTGRLAGAVRVQAVLSMAMLCLAAPSFGGVSIISPAANLLAVPWFSLLVIPPALAGTLLLAVVPPAGEALLRLAAGAVDLAVPVLGALGAAEGAWRPVPEPGVVAVACAGFGVAWLALPRPAPGRVLAGCLLVPLWSGPGNGLATGEFEVAVLDVGQGLAVVARTASTAVLYDAGPRWPGGDAGESTVVPALRAAGLSRLEAVVLSHGDSDHAGGGASVLASLPAARVYLGRGAKAPGGMACEAGQGWSSDGVSFRFLAPGSRPLPGTNDASCVLLIEAAGGRVLLTGDIERAGEAALVKGDHALGVDVVVAPHHGSRSSSGVALVGATRPAWTVFAAGWKNRWGFPHREVVERWRLAGAVSTATDLDGALVFRFRRSGPVPPTGRRGATCRAWRDCGRVAGP